MKSSIYTKAKSASEIDWSKIKWFKKDEFNENEIPLLSKYVVEELDKVRDILEIPIHISPVKGAVIRQNIEAKNSYHYFDASQNIFGQAIDVFLESLIPFKNPIQILIKILGGSRFKGLGFYFDTFYKNEEKMMLHLDLRHTPVIWFRENQKYFYANSDVNFLTNLENHFKNLKSKDTSKEDVCLRKKPLPENHEKI